MKLKEELFYRSFLFSLTGLALGCILFPSAQAGLTIDPNNTKIRGRLWPKATIPYVIETGFNAEGQKNIMTAIQEYNKKTVIKFIPRTREEHYLSFSPWDSMNAGSAIGMQLGPQQLKADRGVWVSTVMHELGHTIGLYHEHNRPDVEQYWRYDGVNPNYAYCKDQFLKIKNADAVSVGAYDYLSVMNYFNGCNISRTPAIVRTRAPYSVEYYNSLYVWGKDGFRMGTNLSPGDIASIKALYASAPASQDWDHTSCVDTPDGPNQCQWLQESGACTSYSHQEVSYQVCPATCSLCKTVGNGGGNGGGGNPGGGGDTGGGGGNTGGGGNACKDTRPADFCLFGATINLCSDSEDFKSLCSKTCGCDGSPVPTVMKNAQGVLDNVNCRYWAVSRCDNTLFVQNACPASCTTLQKYRSEYNMYIK